MLVSKKKYVKLSYTIDEKIPLYPGTPPFVSQAVKKIRNGDSCNTSLISIPNHGGTHVDAPRHFFDSGRSISEYILEELIFSAPEVVDCYKGPEELVEQKDLEGRVSGDCDLLLIRTGFYGYRNKDRDTYCFRNPALSPGGAKWIRENYHSIRAIGIDCISVSCYGSRDSGRETHKILLQANGFGGPPVLILEDVDLSPDLSGLKELMVVPFYVAGIDSAPCTIIGVL